MKKFLLQFILFLAFTLIFYTVSLAVWGNVVSMKQSPNLHYNPKGYGHLNTRIQEVKNTKDIDLLFLGSSHTYRGFDTRLFEKEGYSVFNLGSSSQTPVQTEALVDRYLDQLSPGHVVFEVYPELFMSDGVESSIDIISNDNTDFYSLRMALKVNHLKAYNTLLFAFVNEKIYGLETGEPNKKGGDTYVRGGYVEKGIYHFKRKETPKEKRTIEPKRIQLSAFENIISEIKQRGIKLTLAFIPITNYHYESYKNITEFDSLIKSKEDYDYYNFNQIMDLNDTLHFYDSHHMNQKGVKLFNKKMIEILEE